MPLTNVAAEKETRRKQQRSLSFYFRVQRSVPRQCRRREQHHRQVLSRASSESRRGCVWKGTSSCSGGSSIWKSPSRSRFSANSRACNRGGQEQHRQVSPGKVDISWWLPVARRAIKTKVQKRAFRWSSKVTWKSHSCRSGGFKIWKGRCRSRIFSSSCVCNWGGSEQHQQMS